MSIRDELDEGMTELFEELDDIPVNAVLTHVTGNGVYSPAGGRVPLIGTEPVSVVLVELTEKQSIELCGGLGTYQLLIQVSTITVFPAVGDWFVIDNEKYYVNDTVVDPARVSHISYCSTGAPITAGLK